MIFVLLSLIVLFYVTTVIAGESIENIPNEFNYSPEIIAIKSRELSIASQF